MEAFHLPPEELKELRRITRRIKGSALEWKRARYLILLRDTNEIRRFIQETYGQNYSRSGCIKLLHRLGFEYKKPEQLPAQADEQKQRDFIKNYNKYGA